MTLATILSIRNVEEEATINSEVEKINIWLKLNKLSPNVEKTKLMIFHQLHKKVAYLNPM